MHVIKWLIQIFTYAWARVPCSHLHSFGSERRRRREKDTKQKYVESMQQHRTHANSIFSLCQHSQSADDSLSSRCKTICRFTKVVMSFLMRRRAFLNGIEYESATSLFILKWCALLGWQTMGTINRIRNFPFHRNRRQYVHTPRLRESCDRMILLNFQCTAFCFWGNFSRRSLSGYIATHPCVAYVGMHGWWEANERQKC